MEGWLWQLAFVFYLDVNSVNLAVCIVIGIVPGTALHDLRMFGLSSAFALQGQVFRGKGNTFSCVETVPEAIVQLYTSE